MGEVLKIERADKAANADLNLVGLAVVYGAKLDPQEVEPLPDAGEVLLIARQAVERLDEDHLEGAVPGRIHHAHQAFAAED